VRTIEKLMPAPAPVVVTNVERIFITNTVETASLSLALTNSLKVTEPNATNISEAPIKSLVTSRDGEGRKTAIQSQAVSPNIGKILAAGKASLPWIALIGICGLCARIYLLLIAARTGTVQLALDGKVLEPIEITDGEDVIVLDAQPAAQPKGETIGKAHLTPTWRGTILRPGQQTVTVNDAAITATCRIHRGDTITIQDGEATLRKFDFLGWDPNSGTAQA